MPHQINRPLRTRWSLAAAVLLLSACASTPPPQPEFQAPVFPEPPDAARFIYESTLRYNTNVLEETRMDKLRRFATGAPTEIKGLVKPFGVVAHQGRVYVTDTAQRIAIMFDVAGNRYKEFGHEQPGELFKPVAIDLSLQGELYIADVSARRIAVFDLEGVFQRHIGNKDILKRPSGVAVAPDGKRIYVIDTGGVDNQAHHMYIFDAHSGELLNTIGQRGNKDGDFNLPLQIATAPDGRVYVVDKGNFRVKIFDADGKYLSSFGSIGRFPGQFFSPKGIATDKDGNVYVVDTAFGNVQIFDSEGQLLMVMGKRGQTSAPGNYMLPAGIDVDEQGKVYLVDQFFRKVDIYRPVPVNE